MDSLESFQDVSITTPEREFSPNNAEKNTLGTNETEAMTTMMTTTTVAAGATEAVVEVEACEPEITPELESPEVQVGDHVYQWRSLCGVPYMFQHHGIVMDIIKDEDGKPTRLTIADFSNVETKATKRKKNRNTKNRKQQGYDSTQNNDAKQSAESSTAGTNHSELETEVIDHLSRQDEIENNISNKIESQSSRAVSRRLSLEQEGIVRTYTDTDKWHKVRYQSGWWKCQVYRSGTATKAKSDPVGLVLARVNFILQHPEQLPDYHVVHANCECVAFWCKTGSWSTLQASSFLELTAAGQVKSSATLAATAAGTTANITVPAAGIWGSWFGYTTTTSVSWLSLHPMAIPGLACYAAITVGVPAIMYVTASKKWKKTSQRLSDAFWDAATENPDVFAECLTHWSEKG